MKEKFFRREVLVSAGAIAVGVAVELNQFPETIYRPLYREKANSIFKLLSAP